MSSGGNSCQKEERNSSPEKGGNPGAGNISQKLWEERLSTRWGWPVTSDPPDWLSRMKTEL